MLLIGINSPMMGSFVKQILNSKNDGVFIVLESGITFSQEEVELYVSNQNL